MKKDIQKMMHDTAKWIHGNPQIFLAFISILVIAEVFVFPISSDVRLFGALFLYGFLVRIGKLTSARVFQLCIILLTGMVLGYLIRGAVATTERLAVWFVLFFVLGIFMQWREIST